MNRRNVVLIHSRELNELVRRRRRVCRFEFAMGLGAYEQKSLYHIFSPGMTTAWDLLEARENIQNTRQWKNGER